MSAAGVSVAIKAAAVILTDKRTWTMIFSILAGIIGGFILIIGTMVSIMQGSQQSNQRALGYIFNTQPVDLSLWNLPEEYRGELTAAKNRVNAVMSVADEINAGIEWNKINTLKAGVIYLCLFPNGETDDYMGFAQCFASLETVTERSDGEENSREVTTAISDESVIYANIQIRFGLSITPEQYQNISSMYHFLMTGGIFLAPSDSTGPPAEAYSHETFARLMSVATQFLGWPYVYGGSTPQTSFDCSGFICYVYTTSGVRNLLRTTAQGIYNQCTPISASEAKPGDLIFFHSTYDCPDVVTHLGIYVGEGEFLHAGNPIGYSSLSEYWMSHLYGYGRFN